jgi:FXSXX-COOH protein
MDERPHGGAHEHTGPALHDSGAGTGSDRHDGGHQPGSDRYDGADPFDGPGRQAGSDGYRDPDRPPGPDRYDGPGPYDGPPADTALLDATLLGMDLESLRTVQHPVLSALAGDLRERIAAPGSEALWGFDNDTP